MRKSALALMLLFLSTVASAAEYQQLANMCIACHGSNNDTSFPSIPNLKWQNQVYLTEQLTDFKSGKREDKTMSKVVQLLSEEDIKKLTNYFYQLNNTGSPQ
ncbi:c-type cytochrome [Vibrio splendidus]|uniref:Cytochrome C n=1 Tax=Vibrio splendidus TaxID=29497 RepID=A0A2T5ERJ2_VIBSP|nr:cytochrome c [Vibrio splendidus]OEF69741.1 cytochrome C [Vibrio splendidus 1F-157]PMI12453.1 cytochrome C [Vibrio splendidus]PMJ54127.1 cytochrome C [Vibrio splendidus]PTP27942.1 cytochrome C [Vibrio splendidus]PTP69443.1 cytochrome C [Vibrio splendidus]